MPATNDPNAQRRSAEWSQSTAWVEPTLERYIAYECTPHIARGKYAFWILAILVGTLAMAQRYAFPAQHADPDAIPNLPWFGPGIVLGGIAGLFVARAQCHAFPERLRQMVPVKAALVMANHRLFRDSNINAPCVVLFSLQPGYMSNPAFLAGLAERVYALRETKPADPDLQLIAGMVEDEVYVPYRRRLLPTSFTGGVEVYYADLFIDRKRLRERKITERILYCLVEPGEKGKIELLPWRVVAD